MKVIGKDRTSCDVCNPIDEILARLDALERRASAIVAKVQGIAPDGEGNVRLPTSSSDTDPLHGRIDAFAMSSEVKEAADDAHAYAASIADDVVVLQSDVEILTREVEALDPASVTALEQSVAALQQTVNQLSNLVGGFSAVIRDLEDQMPNKVDRTGDTMTGPLNVIDTATGSRNAQAVNGNRLQDDLDNYPHMVRTTGNYTIFGAVTMNKMIAGTLIPNKKQTAPYGYGANGESWHRTYSGLLASYSRGGTLIVYDVNSNEFAIFAVIAYTNFLRACRVLGNFPLDRIKICKKTTDSGVELGIYFKTSTQSNRLWVYVDSDFSSLNASTPYPNTSIFNPIVPTIPEIDPETSGLWDTVVSGSE